MIVKIMGAFRYLSSKGEIVVPLGYPSDGASVPRIFWSIFSPFNGDYFESAIIHDFLYSNTSGYIFTRKECDQIFLEAMYNQGVGWVTRNTIYSAVRIGGWASYKKK